MSTIYFSIPRCFDEIFICLISVRSAHDTWADHWTCSVVCEKKIKITTDMTLVCILISLPKSLYYSLNGTRSKSTSSMVLGYMCTPLCVCVCLCVCSLPCLSETGPHIAGQYKRVGLTTTNNNKLECGFYNPQFQLLQVQHIIFQILLQSIC